MSLCLGFCRFSAFSWSASPRVPTRNAVGVGLALALCLGPCRPCVAEYPVPARGPLDLSAGAKGTCAQRPCPAASLAIDGNTGTFWSSRGFAPQWISVDLVDLGDPPTPTPFTVTGIRVMPERSQTPGTDIVNIYFRDGNNTWVMAYPSFELSDLEDGQGTTFAVYGDGVFGVKIETIQSSSEVAWREIEIWGVPTPERFALGGNYITLASDGAVCTFTDECYNPVHAARALQTMAHMGMKYVRVGDGPLVTEAMVLRDGVADNLNDFLTAAHGVGLTVIFEFGHGDPALCGTHFHWSEFYEEPYRTWWAQRIAVVTEQVFALRPDVDLIISLYNEPHFDDTYTQNPPLPSPPPQEPLDESDKRILARDWVNWVYGEVRSKDLHPNHLITVGLIQSDHPQAYPEAATWIWPPLGNEQGPGIATDTALDIVDMHLYNLLGMSMVEEFDGVFEWLPQSTKPVIVGETGRGWNQCPEGTDPPCVGCCEHYSAEALADLVAHMRQRGAGNDGHEKLQGALVWTAVPHYNLPEEGPTWKYCINRDGWASGIPDGPFYPLTDGSSGTTRVGASLSAGHHLTGSVTTNHATAQGFPAANAADGDDTTTCVMAHVPIAPLPPPAPLPEPNVTFVDYDRTVRFKRVRLLDLISPCPRSVDVWVLSDGQYVPFGSGGCADPNGTVVDVDCAWSEDGYIDGTGLKIAVNAEGVCPGTWFQDTCSLEQLVGQWSSITEVILNPEVFLPAAVTTDHATVANHPATYAVDDDESLESTCVIADLAPNETIIRFDQPYRFRRIRIVDREPPCPASVDVWVLRDGQPVPLPFGSGGCPDPNGTVVDVDCSWSEDGFIDGSGLRIVVNSEWSLVEGVPTQQWTSMTEVRVNPVDAVPEDLPCLESHFTWSPTNPTVGSQVSFADDSSGMPTGWRWEFMDEPPYSSTDQNVTHTFWEEGTWAVTLTVTRDDDDRVATKTQQVTVSAQ